MAKVAASSSSIQALARWLAGVPDVVAELSSMQARTSGEAHGKVRNSTATNVHEGISKRNAALTESRADAMGTLLPFPMRHRAGRLRPKSAAPVALPCIVIPLLSLPLRAALSAVVSLASVRQRLHSLAE